MASRLDFSQIRSLYIGTSSSTTVDTNNLIVTGLVGVGTTSPGYKLDVAASANSTYPFIVRNAGNVEIGGIYSTSAGAGQIYLFNASTVATVKISTIDSSYFTGGNVGIGTTSPSVRLQVVGANSAEGQLYVGNTDVEYTAGVNFTTSGTIRGFVGWRHTYSTAPFNLTGIHLFNTDNSNIVFGTNNLVRAVIDTNGNVGVGTTSPTYKLQVDGHTGVRNGSFILEMNQEALIQHLNFTSLVLLLGYILIRGLLVAHMAPLLWQ